MTIAAILEGKGRDVIQVRSTDSVLSVVTLLAEQRIGCVPVVDDGQVVGIFSERDLVYRVATEGAAALERPVAEVMTAPAITIDDDTPVMAGLSLMTKRRIRHLPVVVGGDEQRPVARVVPNEEKALGDVADVRAVAGGVDGGHEVGEGAALGFAQELLLAELVHAQRGADAGELLVHGRDRPPLLLPPPRGHCPPEHELSAPLQKTARLSTAIPPCGVNHSLPPL